MTANAPSGSSEGPCVDAPSDARSFLRGLVRRFRCFRVSGLIDAAVHVTAGLYGDRGSGPLRFRALEAPGPSLVCPIPSSDRCAIPLV